jgi:hypothetical protein
MIYKVFNPITYQYELFDLELNANAENMANARLLEITPLYFETVTGNFHIAVVKSTRAGEVWEKFNLTDTSIDNGEDFRVFDATSGVYIKASNLQNAIEIITTLKNNFLLSLNLKVIFEYPLPTNVNEPGIPSF